MSANWMRSVGRAGFGLVTMGCLNTGPLDEDRAPTASNQIDVYYGRDDLAELRVDAVIAPGEEAGLALSLAAVGDSVGDGHHDFAYGNTALAGGNGGTR